MNGGSYGTIVSAWQSKYNTLVLVRYMCRSASGMPAIW